MKYEKVDITFTGDIMCSPNMTKLARNNYSSIFQRAYKLKNCDYLVGNLETPIAGKEMEFTHERYCFNTPESYLSALKECGFNLLTLANNHCMDRDEQGIINTLKNCHNAGFDTVGIYASAEERNTLFIKELNGIKVAFINYTYGTNAFAHHKFLKHPYMVNLSQPEETLPGSIHLLSSYEKIENEVERIYTHGKDFELVKPYLDQLESDIRRAKSAADYVIVIMHSGSQYIREVDPYSLFLTDKIKQFGADIIIGHHQHIIQSCLTDDDGYFKIFCLGNFMCDGKIEMDDFYFDSPLFNAVFHLSLSRSDDGSIQEKKSFSIYTTVKDKLGLPCAIDSYDVYKKSYETYLREKILRYANWFAGSNKYRNVQECYEL